MCKMWTYERDKCECVSVCVLVYLLESMQTQSIVCLFAFLCMSMCTMRRSTPIIVFVAMTLIQNSVDEVAVAVAEKKQGG